MRVRTLAFGALGTEVVVSVLAARDLARAERLARRTLAEVDATCSRFRPDSDLSRVNRRPGCWVDVDPLLVAAVQVAVEAAHRSDGLVHPLLGRDLVSLGYDRDLAVVRRRPAADGTAGLGPDSAVVTRRPDFLSSWQQIGVRRDAVRIPTGTALDLGSVGKAWAADLIARAFTEHLTDAAAVSVGGDVALSAEAPPWPVDVVGQPGACGPPTRVELVGGGLATSSTRVRRWRHAGVQHHHLLDPRTGLPVREAWTTVSASGPSCVAANTTSTAAVVLGDAAPAWLRRAGASARLVAADGRVTRTGDWPEPTRRTA